MENNSFDSLFYTTDTNANLYATFPIPPITKYNKFLREIQSHIPFFQLLPTNPNLPKVIEYLQRFRPSAVIRYYLHNVNTFEELGSLSHLEAERLKFLLNQCQTLLKSSKLKGDIY
jgi:hypothetical protein